MIALHFDASTPDTVKLVFALAEAGMEFEAVPVSDRWSEPHRELAPEGELPVLVDGDFVLREPAFALQYLGETYAPALVPADPWLHYDMQALTQQIDGALGPSVNLLGWTAATSVEQRATHRARLASIPHRPKPVGWHAVWADAEANEDQLANAREKIEAGLDQLAARLEVGDWLVGDSFSLADVNAYALVRAAQGVMAEQVAARQALASWLDRVATRANAIDQVEYSAPA